MQKSNTAILVLVFLGVASSGSSKETLATIKMKSDPILEIADSLDTLSISRDTALFQNKPLEVSQTSIFGEWEVIKFKAGTFSEIGDDEAEKFLGKIILLSPDSTAVFRDKCKPSNRPASPGFSEINAFQLLPLLLPT